jgi:hypothetical protein
MANLFNRKNLYDDDGQLQTTNPLTYGAKFGSGTFLHGQVTGVDNTVLITSGASQQFWLTGITWCGHVETDNYVTLQLNIGAAVFIMTPIPGTADTMVYFTQTFPQPIKVPASTAVTIYSDHADSELAVTLFYYTEAI